MTANCTETSGYKAGRFSFPDPPGATAAPASRPIVPTVPAVPGALLRFRPDRPDRTPGYASNRPVCFGAFH